MPSRARNRGDVSGRPNTDPRTPEVRPAEVHVPPQPLARFADLVGEEAAAAGEAVARETAARLAGRVMWHVNSTAHGGGVAEMLRPLIGYARGAGVDARWLVIGGTPEFFVITKRLHNALHGDPGDGGPLGEAERQVYERVLRCNHAELAAYVRPDDVVVLHDPQTAGLAPALARAGAAVVWRSHIGQDDHEHPLVRRGWEFLAPYLAAPRATVFSRAAYIPAACDSGRSHVIRPSIDPFSPKNQDLAPGVVRSILVQTGIVEGPADGVAPVFRREDGSPERVDRGADLIRVGRAPSIETPLVVQISRWDRLKDHLGVMRGFARLDPSEARGAQLVLAGPTVSAVADDPDGPEVLAELTAAWRALPHETRRRIQLVSLPMVDAQENQAIVNALQRHAAIVVQKSLHEGFGLTVTEAMWKGRPVVASAVGGIVDQVRDGVDGVLLPDPADEEAFARALRDLLADPDRARRMGESARERAAREFLGLRHLGDWARLLRELDDAGPGAGEPRGGSEAARMRVARPNGMPVP